MARWSVLALVFFVACSTSRPAPPPVDPITEPTIIGAVDEAALQGSAEGEEGARIGRNVGRVAGVIAAVFGGPERESVDDMIDRYRDTRNFAETAGAIIGATHGAVEGAKRGYELDLQFAELTRIPGIEVTRPFPDLIEVHIDDRSPLDAIAGVLIGREARAIEIEAACDTAIDTRDALIDLGVPAVFDLVHDSRTPGVILRIEYGY